MNEIETIKQNKRLWQLNLRNKFKKDKGYSLTAHYGCGGLREQVLERDNFKCVICGMSDSEHKIKWDRPITIDHKDRDRKNNTMGNLQTLCLSCHGAKDISPSRIIQKVPRFKKYILGCRENGVPYQDIANELHFSVASIWKWCKRWEVAI